MRDENSREDSAAGWRGVTLARILRPRGVRGEVACEILTDFPERLKALREVWLADARGSSEPRRIGVQRAWISTSRGGQAIFHFEGINNPDEARRLVGRLVQVPLEQRVTLAAGSYFVTDLMGCEVYEGEAALGIVRDVALETGTPLLIVAAEGGRELLIPFAKEICTRIDVAARRIEVRLPDGLRDLNA